MRSTQLRPTVSFRAPVSTARRYPLHLERKPDQPSSFQRIIDLILKEKKTESNLLKDMFTDLYNDIRTYRKNGAFTLLRSWYKDITQITTKIQSLSLSEQDKNELLFLERSLTGALATDREEPLARYDIAVGRIYDVWSRPVTK